MLEQTKKMKVDLTYLKEMSGSNRELILEMIDIFNGQVVEFANDMDKLLVAKEYEKLGKLAHKAKASIAIMGLDDLSKNLKKLELMAKSGENIEEYSGLIQMFKTETQNAVAELMDVKNNMDKYF